MILRLARRLRVATRDEGYALPVVMGLGLLMLTLVATSISVTLSGEQKSKTDEEWNASLAAAYAGIEDYKSRLENDVSYSKYGNLSAPFSSTSTGLTLPTGTSANKAFNITLNADWAIVPGSDDPDIPGTLEASFFRYEVNNSKYGSTGVIRIRATGRVGDETRSVISDLRQEGFNDYVYFTDYEVADPIISGEPSTCEKYAWARDDDDCSDIRFASSDILRGKLHSNDRIVVCGATFKGGVTTASTTNPLYKVDSASCPATTFEAGAPVRVDNITMPPSNDQMRKEARNDLPTEVAAPGCLYTGPTSVTLNANGTMTVISPWTKKTQIAATKAGATTPAMCGTPGTASGQLGHSGGATISVLNHNLLYVQNVTSDTTNDPNGWATSDRPSGFTCSNSGNKNERWSFGGVSYPMANEDTPFTSTAANPAYGCRKGDLFTKGVLKGQMTMAAMNFIYVTGDITYSDNQLDVLGLVGENAVWIWNPMEDIEGSSTVSKNDDDGDPLLSKNRTIYAAILSVKHTIQVQNYHVGAHRGTLTIVGSMAQKFRGTVGTGSGSTGYFKDYGYDLRLTYMSPPKYLTPTSTTFDTTQIAGVPAAFGPNGAPR